MKHSIVRARPIVMKSELAICPAYQEVDGKFRVMNLKGIV